MKRLVVGGVFLVVATELLALLVLDRRVVPWAAGTAVALTLLALRRHLTRVNRTTLPETDATDPGASLGSWLSRTETLIRWSESTRSDWDQRLRPMLARQFEMATGQKKSKDPETFHAAGRMLFGEDLWTWVDPENVARTGRDEPGPGKAALDEILQRLERI